MKFLKYAALLVPFLTGQMTVAAPLASEPVVLAQLDCIGPRCTSPGSLPRPYIPGITPRYPTGQDLYRRTPVPPPVKLRKPEMDFRVPRMDGKPLTRSILPNNPSFKATGLSQKHIQWCAQQYRSYREGDNSFQPFSGQRRQCRSPYL
ncbi:MAG: BA14K family protein [Rhizobiaceae bacterium]|nr:BA14K family protein [Rhizobiaceae bacterium]